MSIGELATFIAVCVAMGFAFRQMRTDPRITKEFLRKSIVVAGLYLLFAACGIGLLLAIMYLAHGAHAALLAIAFLLAWVALGVVWLIRTAPRLREPPRWLMQRWSFVDWTLLTVAVACLFSAVLGL